MPKFNATFTSTITVTRQYEADDEHEARDLALMDAEDGQIGGYPYDVTDADVTSVEKES